MKKIISSILALSLIMSMVIPAFAVESDIVLNAPASSVSMLQKTGKVVEVTDKQVTIEDNTKDSLSKVILNITDDTYLIDAVKGTPLTKKLKVGDTVSAYYSPVMTRSLPPQSNAFAIIGNIPADYKVPTYATIEKLEYLEDGIRVLVDNGGLWVTLKDDINISSYKTKDIVKVNDLTDNSKILVWYDMTLLSYPGQTTATKCVVLSIADNTQYLNINPKTNVLSVNNNILEDVKVYEKDEFTMVPLRKIAEAMGYTVTWNSEENIARLENNDKGISLFLETSDLSVAAINGLTGMYIDELDVALDIENGVTYVPTTFFENNVKAVVTNK